MAEKNRSGNQGLNADPNPLADERAKGGPGRQQQEWPGREEDLKPEADHGEDSYRGAGKLAGRIALITGGDSGIGRAVALAFAREGADVAFSYFDEHDDARETARLVRAAGRRVLAFDGDLADPAHCRDIVQRTVAELGRLDILVNNAAYQMEVQDIADLSIEQLDRTFRTNIYSYFLCAQAALEHMEGGGSIINTGSVTAFDGHPSLLDYSATKGAIHVFTKSLAAAVAERGIRVNCVAPGPVWTPLIPATLEAKHVEEFGADTFWKRPAQPAEIAPAFVFLASEDARYITGEVMAITGKGASR
jgi:NAD(P)-dependent dehydrogenase (short-subunit alcohol dehydrogenase family)